MISGYKKRAMYTLKGKERKEREERSLTRVVQSVSRSERRGIKPRETASEFPELRSSTVTTQVAQLSSRCIMGNMSPVGFYKDLYRRLRSIAKLEFY